MQEYLISRLKNEEDAFVERKSPGVKDRELRKVIVAFANSVREEKPGLIFIGIKDNGEISGVDNTDKLQKQIRRIARDDCYPPVEIQSHVITLQKNKLLVVEVPYSIEKPHFAGPAYIRVGSECIKATDVEYNKLINSRNDKCREIYKYFDSIFTVVAINKKLGQINEKPNQKFYYECKVQKCNQHYIRLQSLNGQNYSEPLKNVGIKWDEEKYRPMLVVQSVIK